MPRPSYQARSLQFPSPAAAPLAPCCPLPAFPQPPHLLGATISNPARLRCCCHLPSTLRGEPQSGGSAPAESQFASCASLPALAPHSWCTCSPLRLTSTSCTCIDPPCWRSVSLPPPLVAGEAAEPGAGVCVGWELVHVGVIDVLVQGLWCSCCGLGAAATGFSVVVLAGVAWGRGACIPSVHQ